MTRLRIAPAARADLREIREHNKKAFGIRATRQHLKGLHQTFELLVGHPRIGVPRPLIGEDMRQFPYKSHRIFYSESAVGLLIVRVLHHARDTADAFSETQ